MGWYINLGCIKDPLFGTPWCLDFTDKSWIPLLILIIIAGIYWLMKTNDINLKDLKFW